MIKIKNNFNLDNTITCGQIFRFKKLNDKYIIILPDRVVSLKMDGDYIQVESSNEDNLESIITEYFDLNRDYDKLLTSINLDKEIIDFNRGNKIIHQDPLITLIEYIISSANKVERISKSLDLISKKCGEKVIFENEEYYLFPSIDKLKELTIKDFRDCKVGFRDKYLYDIVHSNIDLDSINDMDSNDALKYLKNFKGIGTKVASCILLFAYQRLDVYPIDTWVKKYMKDTYNIEGEKNIREFTSNKYKEYSGLVIQYMFNYKRNRYE